MNRMKEAIILAVGLVVMGWCIKCGIDNFANKDRKVNVKGLAEREVAADKIVAVEGDVSDQVTIPITREERIRRIEEERTRQRLLEEERLERSGIDLTQDISEKGMDNLFNAINGGIVEETAEGEYVEDEFSDNEEKQED